MKNFFIDLFEYNNAVNKQVINSFIQNHDKASEKAISIFSHLLNVQQLWNIRILKNEKPYAPWDLHVISEFEEINSKNHKTSLQIINDHTLEDIIDYTNLKGDPFKNSIAEILYHIINHGTYHRGQVALDFRQNGLEPVSTDYILYKRNNQ